MLAAHGTITAAVVALSGIMTTFVVWSWRSAAFVGLVLSVALAILLSAPLRSVQASGQQGTARPHAAPPGPANPG